MILSGNEIKKQFLDQKIKISPFDKAKATTNSYDLALGPTLLRYKSEIIDPKVEQEYEIFNIPKEGYLMQKGEFLLGSSLEKIGSDHFVPLIHAKSGTARMGLFVHVTADLIDIGSYGNSTFQLFAALPIKLYAGMNIAQVTFWKPLGKIKTYNGKYQNSEGPQASKIWMSLKKV